MPFSLGDIHTNRTVPVGSIAIEQVPRSEVNTVVITAIVILSLSWTTVALRIWTRAIVVHSFGWDDATMVVSMAFFSVFCAGVMVTAYVTIGDSFLRIGDLTPAINWLLVAEAFYILSMLTLKLSLGLFFLRIMVKSWQKRIVYVAMSLSTIVSVGYFFFAIFQCGYPSDAWVFFLRKISNKCITPEQIIAVSYTHGGVTTATDVTFAILPLFMLRGSNMNTRERWIVSFILVLGAAGGVASMIRMKFIPKLASGGLTFFADAQTIAVWSTIEPGLGIMAGSLATLRPLFRSCLYRARTYAHSGLSAYGTNKSVGSARPHTRSHSNVGDEAALFNNPNYKGTSIDAGYRIPKEPWRPGGRWAPTPSPSPAQGIAVNEGIEMHERMVREAAEVYDTSRVGYGTPQPPGVPGVVHPGHYWSTSPAPATVHPGQQWV